MSNARNLDPQVGNEPAQPLGGRAEPIGGGVQDVDLSELSPVLIEQDAEIAAPTKNQRKRRLDADDVRAAHEAAAEVAGQGQKPSVAPVAGKSFLDRAAGTALILGIFGLFAFMAGAAATTAVITGMVDLKSAWVKDALKSLKEIADTVKGLL